MTREEAIHYLERIKNEYDCSYEEDALAIAIQALEQEPCEDANANQHNSNALNDVGQHINTLEVDAINRQSVFEQINCWIGSGEYRYTNATHYLMERVKHISSVKPQEPKTEKVIKMRDATPEERESIAKYIKSISKPTGIDFWDLDDNDDCISRKAVLSLLADHFDNVFDMVKELELPSVAIPSAEPKTGHWIGIDEEPHEVWECDHCGFVIDGSGCIDPYDYRDTYKFCPNCGAGMTEEQERSE